MISGSIWETVRCMNLDYCAGTRDASPLILTDLMMAVNNKRKTDSFVYIVSEIYQWILIIASSLHYIVSKHLIDLSISDFVCRVFQLAPIEAPLETTQPRVPQGVTKSQGLALVGFLPASGLSNWVLPQQGSFPQGLPLFKGLCRTESLPIACPLQVGFAPPPLGSNTSIGCSSCAPLPPRTFHGLASQDYPPPGFHPPAPRFCLLPQGSCHYFTWPPPPKGFQNRWLCARWARTPRGFHHRSLDDTGLAAHRTSPPPTPPKLGHDRG
jgi:hypothetical protein